MAVGEWRAGDEKSTLQMMCVVVGEEVVVEQLLSGANESARRQGEDLSSDHHGKTGRGLEPGGPFVLPHWSRSSTSLRIARDTIVLSCDIPYVGYCRKDRILRASAKYART